MPYESKIPPRDGASVPGRRPRGDPGHRRAGSRGRSPFRSGTSTRTASSRWGWMAGRARPSCCDAAGRATVTVQDEAPPYRYVSVEGPVEILSQERDVLGVASRYLGPEFGACVRRAEPRRPHVGRRPTDPGTLADPGLLVSPRRCARCRAVTEMAPGLRGSSVKHGDHVKVRRGSRASSRRSSPSLRWREGPDPRPAAAPRTPGSVRHGPSPARSRLRDLAATPLDAGAVDHRVGAGGHDHEARRRLLVGHQAGPRGLRSPRHSVEHDR